MATLETASAVVYDDENDQVPELYRSFFNNGDWVLHSFTVIGSWFFLALAIGFHIFLWGVKNWHLPV